MKPSARIHQIQAEIVSRTVPTDAEGGRVYPAGYALAEAIIQYLDEQHSHPDKESEG